jgi:hypothetical protein
MLPMSECSFTLINTQLQPGADALTSYQLFQRLSSSEETVETVGALSPRVQRAKATVLMKASCRFC